MVRKLELTIAVSVAALLAAAPAAAQDVLGELYGQGVHSYFARNYTAAHRKFSEAIKRGSRDPRCSYFRALIYLKLGRPEDAEKDFRIGAQDEMTANTYYAVGQSLERIQGVNRLRLERYRRQARLEAGRRTYLRRRAPPAFPDLQPEEDAATGPAEEDDGDEDLSNNSPDEEEHAELPDDADQPEGETPAALEEDGEDPFSDLSENKEEAEPFPDSPEEDEPADAANGTDSLPESPSLPDDAAEPESASLEASDSDNPFESKNFEIAPPRESPKGELRDVAKEDAPDLPQPDRVAADVTPSGRPIRSIFRAMIKGYINSGDVPVPPPAAGPVAFPPIAGTPGEPVEDGPLEDDPFGDDLFGDELAADDGDAESLEEEAADADLDNEGDPFE